MALPALPPEGDGTFASYQGFGLARCTFQRTRGWGSSSAVVEVLVSTLPPGFTIAAPKLPTLFKTQVRAGGPAEASATRLRQKFEPFGFLLMREVVRGVPHEHPAVLLYIVRAEEIRKADGSPVGRVRLSLEDVRYFYPRGLLPRWSFNRYRADGTVALDSVKPNGDRHTKGEVAQILAAALPGQPKLSAYPGRWDQDSSPQEFPRFGIASAALAKIASKAGLEDACLRIDGSLALHAAGEGMLGYAPNGAGPNSQPFPPSVILDKNGQGRGKSVEPGYPEEFLLVVGGERVVSVAVDDWEPVIQFPDGQVRKLDEALVRRLTGGAFGLDWLSKFALQPSAYQHHPSVDPDVASLLADQAWQVYRLPGVSVETVVGPEGADEFAQERANGEGAPTVITPGPNAHLLPIRPRAETVNGKRQAPLVEAYSFTTQHVKLAGRPGQEALTAIEKEISTLLASLPGGESSFQLPNTNGKLHAADVFTGFEDVLKERGVQVADIEAALQQARAIEQIRERGGSGPFIADQLQRLYAQRLEAEEAVGLGGGRSEMFAAALEILEGEKVLRDDLAGFKGLVDPSRGVGESEIAPSDVELAEALQRRDALRRSLVASIGPLLTRAQQEREERDRRIATTGTPSASPEAFGLVVLSNRPLRGGAREPDTGARVIDDEAGLVRLSSLSGHIDPDGCSDASQATFRPRAVRVTFGVTLRPRVDVPPPAEIVVPSSAEGQTEIVAEGQDTAAATLDRARKAREVQGDTARAALERARRSAVEILPGGGQNVISDALSDQESYYTAAFKRVARGSIETVPVGLVPLDRAARIDEPDMVELVRLDGSSNRADLDAAAQRLATERSNVPDVIESQRVLLARPWPVQCDGVVSSVTITMREKDGVPCGFETLVTTGSNGAPPLGEQRTTVRPRDGGGGAGARREGMA